MKYLSLLFVLLTGCATIITGSTDNVIINSNPSGVPFTIQNKQGVIVTSGVTPTTVILKKGDGYFDSQIYRVNYSLLGYYPQTTVLGSTLNPWYFGNLLFGGIIIGGVIVDPLTGAMWHLPKETNSILFTK